MVATALTTVGLVATPAAAAEKITLGISGFMEQWVGYGDNDEDFSAATAGASGVADGTVNHVGFDVNSDTEIHFQGKTVLDNGIEIAVNMELEGDTAVGGIDDSFLEITSEKLGILQIGGAEHSIWQAHVASPDVGIGNQDGDYANWIATPGSFTDSAITGFNPDVGNSAKLAYFSPMVAGFAVMASFNPDTPTAAGGAFTANTESWTAGIAFDSEMGGVGIVADVGYGELEKGAGVNALRAWQAGLNVSFAGLTFGGSAVLNDEHQKFPESGTFADGITFDVGVAYEVDAYAASITWLRSELEGDNTIDAEDVKDSVMVSGSYAMGPGVDLKGSVFWVSYDDETSADANNNEGWGAVAGLALEF